ncbi:MAG: 2OG-Fe(II) oxygenase [Acidobacteriota bacterium]|nr:2OG-Fe(II) oxygenase [Acidobacteriota bacterium]
MEAAVLDRLAELLSGTTEAGVFSAGMTVPADDLALEVLGVGPIKFPVSAEQAAQLCELSRPARHGQGARTVLDRRVRDTWEVPKPLVKIDGQRFERTLRPSLDHLGQELGLPLGDRLRAELHAMLVYSPGQFFLEHQDSEKSDAMVGTLVVGLPSSFRGGALQIRHRGEERSYRGSRKSLSLVAFYGDCRHEAKPVTSGYRVVLTYNLLLDRGDTRAAADLDAGLVADVAGCLDEHFASADEPGRLVYLLDHEYTRSGLDGARLKGSDAERAGLLAAAAEQAGCGCTLALVDIHETWSAYEPERSRWSRYRDWDYRDDEDWEDRGSDGQVDPAADFELEDLIESETTLDSWIDPRDGRLKQIGLRLDEAEVCESTALDELRPYAVEYEGYMGNWGNTLDRWYHRGAAVVWPRALSFALQALADPEFALGELLALARKGDLAGARAAAATLEPFWDEAAAKVTTKRFLGKALRAARLLDDPDEAAALLAPFSLELLGRSHAAALAALTGHYGEAWTQALVSAWSAKRRYYYGDRPVAPETWIAGLPALCEALGGAGPPGPLAGRALVADSWAWARGRIDGGLALPRPTHREQALAALAAPLAAVIEAAAVVGAIELAEEARDLLCSGDALVGCAIATLRAASASSSATASPSATALASASALAPSVAGVLGEIADRSAAALQLRVARPLRDPDDWSIELPQGCGCELCAELRAFLGDAHRTSLDWPLAKNGRQHVHQRIDATELPVRHDTRRSGRPYTLVLTKTEALFEDELRQRRRDEQDLAWITDGRAA